MHTVEFMMFPTNLDLRKMFTGACSVVKKKKKKVLFFSFQNDFHYRNKDYSEYKNDFSELIDRVDI